MEASYFPEPEAEEQHSDNGGGDEEAEQHAAMLFYESALAALNFNDEAEDDAFMARIQQMKPSSDDEQGWDSDTESYGKEEEHDEPAPRWV